MNSIGVFRSIAACANACAGALMLFCSTCAFAAAIDCGPVTLSAQERLSHFKDLDMAAQSAMEQRRLTEAVQDYQRQVCLVPDSARAFYGLGVAEAASGDFLNALDALRTADRLQPTSSLPLAMQVRVNYSLKDFGTLKADLREAAARFPRDAQLHQVLGRFLAEKQMFALALAESLRAQQGGADPASKVQLAGLENAVGAYDDAIHNAVALERQSELATGVRASAAGIAGLSYESLGQRDEAARHLQEALRLDPSRENSYLALADLFEQSQSYRDAVKILKQGRTNIPDSPALLLPLGVDLIRTEQYREGVDILRALLQQSQDQDQAYLSLADAYRKMGNSEQEVGVLRELSRRKPDYPMVHVLIARAMLGSDHVEYPRILDELAQAEKSAPADPDVFYLRGKVYLAMNRYQDAVAALRRSIELRPMETGPYYQLARLYQKLGESKLANEQFERVKYLEGNPSK